MRGFGSSRRRAELPFAGHPVLGSAFVLGAPLQLVEIRLETGSGVIPVTLEREGARITFGRMQQPIPNWEPFEQAEELQELLGVRSQLPVEAYDLGPHHVFLELGSKAEVAALEPDFGALARLTHMGVNCFAGSGTSWKTRMFAPASGVAEDPATGSACGPLGIHLARHGRIGIVVGVHGRVASSAEEVDRSRSAARPSGAPSFVWEGHSTLYVWTALAEVPGSARTRRWRPSADACGPRRRTSRRPGIAAFSRRANLGLRFQIDDVRVASQRLGVDTVSGESPGRIVARTV